MPQASERKAVSFPVTVWFVPKTGQFHIARPTHEGCFTTVSADPHSARGHPHLFGKLSLILQESSVQNPGTDNTVN